MKASQFLAEYGIHHSARPIDKPDNETDVPGHPWFQVRFFLPDEYDARETYLDYGGAVSDDVNTINAEIAEVFYRMAEAARHGESYEVMVEEFGTDLHITPQQWEQGQHAVRRRCRAWLTEDIMWEEFLAVEIDDTGSTRP